ncbi:MAG: DUF2188 domain-containing protein [Blastocatellia bacterium]
MAGKNLHVIPHDKKWAIRDEGSTHIRSVYDTKQEAIDAARDLARSRKASLVVYGRNGQPLLKTKAPSSIRDDEIRRIIRVGTAKDWRGGTSKTARKTLARKGPTRP